MDGLPLTEARARGRRFFGRTEKIFFAWIFARKNARGKICGFANETDVSVKTATRSIVLSTTEDSVLPLTDRKRRFVPASSPSVAKKRIAKMKTPAAKKFPRGKNRRSEKPRASRLSPVRYPNSLVTVNGAARRRQWRTARLPAGNTLLRAERTNHPPHARQPYPGVTTGAAWRWRRYRGDSTCSCIQFTRRFASSCKPGCGRNGL